MSKVRIDIDGKEIEAEKGMTILDVAKGAGIEIPTLCDYEGLEPYGGCRLCTVEVETKGRKNYVVSCLFPVEDGLIVRTKSEEVKKIRKLIIALLLSRAPDSEKLKALKEEYEVEDLGFERDPVFCILCGLCVRYCSQVKKNNAIIFCGNGIKREVKFIPEIAIKVCDQCKECFPLCPTSYVQALYLLTKAYRLATLI